MPVLTAACVRSDEEITALVMRPVAEDATRLPLVDSCARQLQLPFDQTNIGSPVARATAAQ
jgi:hypothetical protein